VTDPDLYRRIDRLEKIIQTMLSAEVPLRAIGAGAVAFGAFDLANANAITGDLPDAKITEWADGVQQILDTLRSVFKDARDLQALFEDNPSVYAAILATAPGEVVPGTTRTKEALILIGALMQDAMGWIADPVVGDPPHEIENPPTRRAVVMAR
jgi:hypothetical protein